MHFYFFTFEQMWFFPRVLKHVYGERCGRASLLPAACSSTVVAPALGGLVDCHVISHTASGSTSGSITVLSKKELELLPEVL